MYIVERASGELVEVEIERLHPDDLPGRKDGWSFDWKSVAIRRGTETYGVRLERTPKELQGMVHLRKYSGMLIMDLLEVAPHNVGSKAKRFDRVAGILIAFSCRKSFMVEEQYRGFLTFEAKTELINMYRTKYGAKLALGQRMYIEPSQGIKLIDEYLTT